MAENLPTSARDQNRHEAGVIRRVAVTGATGFVGRYVVREMLSRGLHPVCFVRSPERFYRTQARVRRERFTVVKGEAEDSAALAKAVQGAEAVIHLVGIIMNRRLQGQTFRRVHIDFTRRVLEAAGQAGVRRYVHMSALGTRAEALTEYHRTKWVAETLVRESGMDWTMFRPSLIHGPDGEFMRLMRRLCCGWNPPFVPLFGEGSRRVQPVSVRDVAFCMVESLDRPESAGQVYPLGGPRVYRWRELFELCRRVLPGARQWKPLVSLPLPVAKLLALGSAAVLSVAELSLPSLGLMRFDRGQVAMSQEDNVCDPGIAQRAFGIRPRDFEVEFAGYADQIT